MVAFHSLTHKLLSVHMNNTIFQKELNIIGVMPKNNSYNPVMVDKLIQKKVRIRLFLQILNLKKKLRKLRAQCTNA